jgi:hypothetical protein
LCDAADTAAWEAWWEPAGCTPKALMLIIVAPSSHLEAAVKRENCGSRLNRTSSTRQAIF